MAKMRIYELAKELGVENKEILDFLAEKNIEVKSHMSSLEDEQIDMVRQAFQPQDKKSDTVKEPAPAKEKAKEPKPEETKAKESKTEESKPEEKKAPAEETEANGTAPKKKTIVQVFRPQNSKNGNRMQGNRQGQRPQGQRSQGTQGSQQGRTSRPQGAGTGQRPSSGQPRTTRTQAGANGAAARPVRRSESSEDTENRQAQRSQEPRTRQRASSAAGTAERPHNRAPRAGETEENARRAEGQAPRTRQRPQAEEPVAAASAGQSSAARSQGRPEKRKEGQDTMSAPMKEQQKTQRNNKEKDKEKDYKKKELKDEEFENKAKKGKKQKPVAEAKKPEPKKETVEEIKSIVIPEALTIKDLADKMKIAPSVIVKKLFMQGQTVTVNQEIDYDTAEEIALEFDVLCEKEQKVDVIEELLKEEEEDPSTLQKRPPVVCVMGHVDHGKTSLLDAIRHSNVIEGEAGGITQRIGASVVEIDGRTITFLDTPGHEAFTAMRMRGANSTDIAILVVAADDGVMPQTVEAINHAKAAGIEIIVAINKIDKPGANVEKVKQELTEYELVAEDWGGSTVMVPVSAHTGEGIQDLLEMILLTADVMELKANPDRAARGVVIEAQLDKGRGPVATVLVQKGTLNVGDAVAVGSTYGKVRAMMDDHGRRVNSAGPSKPVEILGLNDVPDAGEVFVGCETEKDARNFAETYIAENKSKLVEETKSKMSLDDLFNQIQEGNLKELNIVIKADVQGSVEALKQSLLKLSNDEVVLKVIHGGVGSINESDVILASASNAIIIGFNVQPDATAKETAEDEGVDIRLYDVIYNAIDDMEAAMKGMLDPVYEEQITGHAEVRQTFKASKVGTIAGAYVLDGIFERSSLVRQTRDGEVIYEGPLASLRRFQDDVKEVKAGFECGFVFENHNDVQEGDQVEAYKMVQVERK